MNPCARNDKQLNKRLYNLAVQFDIEEIESRIYSNISRRGLKIKKRFIYIAFSNISRRGIKIENRGNRGIHENPPSAEILA